MEFTLNLRKRIYCMTFEKLRKIGGRETHNKKKKRRKKKEKKILKKRVQYNMKELKSMKMEFELYT